MPWRAHPGAELGDRVELGLELRLALAVPCYLDRLALMAMQHYRLAERILPGLDPENLGALGIKAAGFEQFIDRPARLEIWADLDEGCGPI